MEENGRGIDEDFETESGHHFFLPNELVIEILLRLPVESLLRFKTICKYWYDIITSSTFVDNHFDHHSNHSRLLVSHLMADIHNISDIDSEVCYSLSIFPNKTLVGDPPSHHQLDYLQMPESSLSIIGPVKGLLLLCRDTKEMSKSNDYRLALLNPATREYKALVVPDSRYNKLACDSQTFGLGFDPLTNDIKVISLWYWNKHDSFRGGYPRVAVYSLANDSWKHLDALTTNSEERIGAFPSTTYLNGSCYWLLRYMTILSFDLTGEVFREIEGPNEFSSYYPVLIIHNDCLTMVLKYPKKLSFLKYIDILVMKEEGCWTKELRIDANILQIQYCEIGFWQNNSLLFINTEDGELVMYNPYTNEIKGLGIGKQIDDDDEDAWRGMCSAFIYKESLISLKGSKANYEKHYLLQDFFTYSNPSPENNYSYTDEEKVTDEEDEEEVTDEEDEDQE